MNIEARDVTTEGCQWSTSNVLMTSDLYSDPVMSIPAWFTESFVTRMLRSFGSRSFQLQDFHPQQGSLFMDYLLLYFCVPHKFSVP